MICGRQSNGTRVADYAVPVYSHAVNACLEVTSAGIAVILPANQEPVVTKSYRRVHLRLLRAANYNGIRVEHDSFRAYPRTQDITSGEAIVLPNHQVIRAVTCHSWAKL